MGGGGEFCTLTFQPVESTRHHTSPPCMFFMLKPSLPVFPFLFFFFLQQHFLIIQKQQVRMSKAATTAIAIRAHGGTVIFKTTERKLRLYFCISYNPFYQINSILGYLSHLHGILSISFKNLLLISSNMSFLLISVLLELELVSTTVDMTAGVGAMVTVVAPVGSSAATACGLLNKLNFIVKD